MRWVVATVGALLMLGAAYLVLRPRLHRPVLRVALNLRTGNLEDEALAAGVALALEERDARAGGYRLKTAHQQVQPNGSVSLPTPCAHTMLYGLELPRILRPEGFDEPHFRVEVGLELRHILAWARNRGLRRVVRAFGDLAREETDLFFGALDSQEPLAEAAKRVGLEAMTFTARRGIQRLDSAGDLVFIENWWSIMNGAVLGELGESGYSGALFVSGNLLKLYRELDPTLGTLQGARIVMARMKAPPPDFLRRHSHPYAYAGYRGALRLFDALDVAPKADPMQAARDLGKTSIFDDLLEEPRVFVIKNGRLSPE